jgi:hypothetical protein
LHYPGVVKFDPATGKQFKGKTATKAYTTYYAEALIAEAELDSGIVGIHAAMGGGTGMNIFNKRFPERCFDVGIAEQHAVTFAAGLACEGMKPFCTIYSSFLQRAYDQVEYLLPYLIDLTHPIIYLEAFVLTIQGKLLFLFILYFCLLMVCKTGSVSFHEIIFQY